MTELRYLPDSDGVTEFTDTVAEATDRYVTLEGTYFYPEGGGQPADRGTLEWTGGRADVVDVRKSHGDVRHRVDGIEGEPPAPGTAVTGRIDAERRRAHSRMHTAQHVLSQVVLEEYGATTAGNQVGADRSRIDFEPAEFDDGDLERIERLANEAIERDLAVRKVERPRREVEERVEEGRALLDLLPESVDPLRVVEIEGFDYCPCGGTHVDRLGEIGPLEIVDRSSKGAAVERIEFALADG